MSFLLLKISRFDLESTLTFCLWWVWGLILNMIAPIKLACWDISFALGHGISFFFWWDPTFSYQWLFSSELQFWSFHRRRWVHALLLRHLLIKLTLKTFHEILWPSIHLLKQPCKPHLWWLHQKTEGTSISKPNTESHKNLYLQQICSWQAKVLNKVSSEGPGAIKALSIFFFLIFLFFIL